MRGIVTRTRGLGLATAHALESAVRMRLLVVVGSACLALAGCGGGSDIEEAVKDETGATEAYCVDAGWMQFVGERETVYECYEGSGPEDELDEAVEDVIGPSGRPLGCYVFIDGKLSDVSIDVGDEFTCG